LSLIGRRGLSEKETMKNGIAAVKFLTISQRFSWVELDPEQVGKGASYFPLVGLFLGAVLVMTDRVLESYLGSEILSVVLVAVLALMTGALHFEGLQETFEALLNNSRLNGTNERQNGIVGLLAVVFVVILKVRCLEITGETRSVGLLLAPVFARWALVLFIYGAVARTDRAAQGIVESVRAWQLICATFITLAVAAFFIGRAALWIGLYISLFALISRAFLAQHSPQHYGHFGAIVELSETLSFMLFSTF
jgi:adenosylcobinamide-GDP ribazoletransferase